MKTSPSRYVLVAEIIAITLFHAVQIKKTEKSSPDKEFVSVRKSIHPSLPVEESMFHFDFKLLNMLK